VSTDSGEIQGFQILDQIAANALDDESYRRTLIADPKAVLREEGLTVADELEVVVVENTADRVYLVLPSQPPQSLKLDVSEVALHRLIPFNKF
jgi:Nitrile hydratase, alpha chain